MGEEREGRERRKRKEGTKIGVYIEGERKGMKQGREGRKEAVLYISGNVGGYVCTCSPGNLQYVYTYTRF